MKKERFFELMNETDEFLIERAEKYSAHNVNLRAHRIVRWTAIAACICMILIACIAVPIAMRMGDKGDLDIDDESTSSEAVGSIENENANPENDPIEDAYSSRPGVYREKDYPDMPGTDGLIYMLSPEKDAYYIKGYKGTDTDVYIPATHEGLPVTQILSWSEGECLIEFHSAFMNNEIITSVVIGKNIEALDGMLFKGCSNLKKVVIPDSVKQITNDPFAKCNNLSEIIISDKIKALSEYVFRDTAYYNDQSNWIDGVLYVGNHVLKAKNVGETCTIRAGTKTIAEEAFYSKEKENNRMTEVILPKDLREIGRRAFFQCNRLKKVTSLGDIKCIAFEAFGECMLLSEFNFAGRIEDISSTAIFKTSYYNNSDNWENGILYLDEYLMASNDHVDAHVVVKEGTRVIAKGAFLKTNILSITLPSSLETVCNSPFGSCYKLFEVYNLSSVDIKDMIPSRVKSVYTSLDVPTKFVQQDEFIFYCDDDAQEYLLVDYWGESTNLVLPDTVGGKHYEIYPYAFKGNTIIKELVIADTVTKIESGSFSGCSNLEKLTLGAGVINIGSQAFLNCKKLNSIVFNDNLVSIEKSAFYRCASLVELSIPDSVASIGESAFYECSKLQSIILPKNITNIESETFASCTALESIVIPNGVTSIGDYAFAYCESLTEISIPDNVTSIGELAFHSCSKLQSITLSKNIITIADGAFMDCVALERIDIPDGVSTIEKYVFSGCTSLKEIDFGSGIKSIEDGVFVDCENLSKIILPDGVETIGEALTYSGVAYIEIPDSVKLIDYYTFAHCEKLQSILLGSGIEKIMNFAFMESDALDAIYYKGSAEDWNKVECGEKVFLDSSATVYFYSETQPTTAGNFWHYVDGVATKW